MTILSRADLKFETSFVSNIEIARQLLRNGYHPVWIRPGSKAPGRAGWADALPTEESIERDFKLPGNIGLVQGVVAPDRTFSLTIDIDLDDAPLIGYVEATIGNPCPKKRGKKGMSFILRAVGDISSGVLHDYRNGKRPAGDILAKGKQTVIPPSTHPDTGAPYRWWSELTTFNTPYQELPLIDDSAIKEIKAYLKNVDNPIAKLNDMTWKGVGGGGDTHDSCVAAVGRMVADDWTDEQIHARIRRAKREACEKAGETYHWPAEAKTCQEWIDSAREKEFGTQKRPPKLSHGQIAEIVIERFGDRIRRDRASGSWFVHNGKLWERDAPDHVKQLIRQVLPPEQIYRATVDGVEGILRTHKELWVDIDEWDSDPQQLNMPSGTMNLKTRQSSAHDPRNLNTMMTRVSPNFDYQNSRWVKELRTWFGESDQEIDYIHRFLGLCLTGETRDNCVAMWIGRSGTGKSKIAEIVHYILGDYAQVARDTAFIDVRYNPHIEEIARMRGKRMVQIHEAEGSLNLQRVKSVSSGDRLSASFKGKDSFEFTPVAKLWFISNEPPPTRSSGREMQRRLHVYEFTRIIEDKQMDLYLSEALKAEAEMILGWLIDGAVKYYRDGLTRSPHVIESTRRYFGDADIMEQWIEDECMVEVGAITPVAILWDNFSPWADEAGIRAKPDKGRFSSRLKAKGFELVRKVLATGKQPARCIQGLRLKTDDERPIRNIVFPGDTH